MEQDQQRRLQIVASGVTETRAALKTVTSRVVDLTRDTAARAASDVAAAQRGIAMLESRLAPVVAEQTATGRRLDAMDQEEQRRLQAVVSSLADARAGLNAVGTRIADLARGAAERAAHDLAATQSAISALRDSVDTPRRRLDEVARGTAVFFPFGSAAYRDPETAQRELRRLAEAIANDDGGRVRIVGYGDGIGTPQGNLDAARLRAKKVASDLQTMGVRSDRLLLSTTRPPLPLADEALSGANRRVVFELVFPGE